MRHSVPLRALPSQLSLPRLLCLLLLLSGALLATSVPLAGAPAPLGRLLGQPGVYRTNHAQLRQLEDNIAQGRAGPFTITLSQADLDAEVAWQIERLKGRLPVSGAFLQPGEGVLNAGGTLEVGPVAVPVGIELTVEAHGCKPTVGLRRIEIGGSSTPAWLKARADALVRQKLDEGLQRGLGFCLISATFRPGQIIIDGSVEGS